MIKIIIGIGIIVVSFIYILKNKNVSLMDSLMSKRKKQMEELEALANQETSEEDPTQH